MNVRAIIKMRRKSGDETTEWDAARKLNANSSSMQRSTFCSSFIMNDNDRQHRLDALIGLAKIMAQMKFYLDLEDKIVEKYFQLDLEHEL